MHNSINFMKFINKVYALRNLQIVNIYNLCSNKIRVLSVSCLEKRNFYIFPHFYTKPYLNFYLSVGRSVCHGKMRSPITMNFFLFCTCIRVVLKATWNCQNCFENELAAVQKPTFVLSWV